MKVLLVALNATYSQSNLALRYFDAYLGKRFTGLETLEFNINQDLGLILGDLVRRQPDLVGFSCYIWNIEQILILIGNLRKVSPETVIILGGPEVSFDPEYWLGRYPAIDYLVAGEGEEALGILLEEYELWAGRLDRANLHRVPGLAYRQGECLVQNDQTPVDLAALPPIYRGDLSDLRNKIVYYETTRGCPFRCAYCLSSVMGPVRKFPLERSKAELALLAQSGVEQVRFVDRTFNYDAQRAYELLAYMISLETTTRFQLEVSGDILTDQLLELLTKAPYNRFQLEIGVQSTNPATLAAVSRKCDLGRLQEVVRFLKDKTTVRVLVDLIAGLPAEGFWRFGESFDYAYKLKADRLHLGFLKLLRGSRLRAEVETFGCAYTEQAPYEVLCTDQLSFAELRRLKVIEDLVEKYSGPRFASSLDYLQGSDSPFGFFNQFAEKWEAAGHHWFNHSLMGLYRIIWGLFGAQNPDLLAHLRYDFRKNEPRQLTPAWMGGVTDRRLEHELIQSGRILEFAPELAGLRPRQIGRRIFVEELNFGSGRQLMLFYFAEGRRTAHTFVLEQN